MYEFYPLLILGAIIGAFSLVFIFAYAFMKNKKEAIGFDRNGKETAETDCIGTGFTVSCEGASVTAVLYYAVLDLL